MRISCFLACAHYLSSCPCVPLTELWLCPLYSLPLGSFRWQKDSSSTSAPPGWSPTALSSLPSALLPSSLLAIPQKMPSGKLLLGSSTAGQHREPSPVRHLTRAWICSQCLQCPSVLKTNLHFGWESHAHLPPQTKFHLAVFNVIKYVYC